MLWQFSLQRPDHKLELMFSELFSGKQGTDDRRQLSSIFLI